MTEIMIKGYKCDRCGHEWVKNQSTQGVPVMCPGCKSAYWNRGPRKK